MKEAAEEFIWENELNQAVGICTLVQFLRCTVCEIILVYFPNVILMSCILILNNVFVGLLKIRCKGTETSIVKWGPVV